MKLILKAFLKRLTNLSQKNRSLLLLKNSTMQDIDLHEISVLQKDAGLSLISNLLRSKSYELIANLDPRSGSRNTLASTLAKIERRNTFIFRESGAKDLYLGWPFVHGKLPGGTLIRCPLIFFPVKLLLKDNIWHLQPREDVNITFNKNFLLAYSFFNKQKLEEEFIETVFNDFDSEPRTFLNGLYEKLKSNNIAINFNQALYEENIIPFKDNRKDEFDKKHGDGELKLFSEVVLGIFPQSGSHLVPDYEVLLEENKFADLESFFVKKSLVSDPTEQVSHFRLDFLNKIKEEETFTPFPLDASQENALKAVKKGHSLVVQGPPGSGKSQLISNMISDFVARGKKVLLVCQKRAALDVVHQRLKEKQLDKFCALVHDFKNDRKAIYDQIGLQIDSLEDYKRLNNGLDTIYLERSYLKSCREIDHLSEDLEEFKNALFDNSECGLSAKELYLQSEVLGPLVNIKEEFRQFHFDKIQENERTWKMYARLYFKFEKEDYLWQNRVSFAEFTTTDLNGITNALNEIPQFKEKVNTGIKYFISNDLSIDEHEQIVQNEIELRESMQLLESDEVLKAFRHYQDYKTDDLWLQNKHRIIMDCFSGEGVETSVASNEIGNLQQLLDIARKKRKHIVNWFLWSLFSKEHFMLKRVLVQNELDFNKSDLNTLESKLTNRMNLEHNLSAIRKSKWTYKLPEARNKKILQPWFETQHKALKTKSIIEQFRSIKSFFNFKNGDLAQIKQQMEVLIGLSKLIHDYYSRWNKHLSKKQINNQLFSDRDHEKLLAVLRRDFEELCLFDRLKNDLSGADKSVLNKVLESPEVKNESDMWVVFMNSLKLTWIEQLELKYPVLREAGTEVLANKIETLQESIAEKEKRSNEILLMRLREKTYDNVEYNRLNNLVTYRELQHQVNKKRQIWPLRQLISKYYQELFDLIPCWMASPESVSAMFPLEDLFDLVIFDEASQCFAEQGIPAMYRGKQIVIMGDSQQLRPSDLYQIRYEEEQESESIDLEVESLLELGAGYLMEISLKGHYRSANLELIAFSNKHFYNNSLRILPSPSVLFSRTSAFDYHYLPEGVWQNNTNKTEAEKVCELVRNYVLNGTKDIGVITFNFAQQNLILDLLEEQASKEKWIIPDELFVKNIENVQGDERAIIIFSIAYARDLNGNLRQQFGLLNMQGGENRLNVAITRAREKIDLVSSILPHDLKTEGLMHDGPKLLKSYLQFVWNAAQGEPATLLQNDAGHSELQIGLKDKLAASLKDKEFKMSLDMPFADLIYWNDAGKAFLIFTDDNLFFESYSAKEAFAYRPMEMKKKHWDYKFILSRQYWQESEVTFSSLTRFITK